MSAPALEREQVLSALAGLPGWRLVTEGPLALARSYVFQDFNAAFGFMTRVALVAEAMDHHPDWSNSYRKVEVRLTTHSAGGITRLDLDLARKMDEIAKV